jgi:hypothetical protein
MKGAISCEHGIYLNLKTLRPHLSHRLASLGLAGGVRTMNRPTLFSISTRKVSPRNHQTQYLNIATLSGPQ